MIEEQVLTRKWTCEWRHVFSMADTEGGSGQGVGVEEGSSKRPLSMRLRTRFSTVVPRSFQLAISLFQLANWNQAN